jgi:hypothetical protein
MTPSGKILEALRCVTSIAVTHGFLSLDGSASMKDVEFLPATLDRPGVAGISIGVAKDGSVAVSVINGGREDDRWEAAGQVMRAIVKGLDPSGSDLIRSGIEHGEQSAYVNVNSGGASFYRFLRMAGSESAHDHLDADIRLEALMVEAGIAADQARFWMALLTEA